MKRYSTYKDSGIDWLGEIPEHWEVKPIKYVGEIVLGKMLTPDDKGGYFRKPYLRAQNITWEKVDTEDIKEMWFSEKDLSQYRLKENDVLVSEGGEVGRTAIWQNELSECYIQNSVHKITIKSKNNPHYYLYHFLIYGKTGYFDSIVNRVSIAHLTREKLKEIMFLSPTLSEQQTIANYLDRKTRQIDTLIENKQKLIALLKEQRAAIINQAVTKGLNPDVKLKDSGIEWLGEISEGWGVERLKYIASVQFSNVDKKTNENEEKVHLCNYIDVYNNEFITRKIQFMKATALRREIEKFTIKYGDVLATKDSETPGDIANAALVTEDISNVICGYHLAHIRPDRRFLLGVYLFRLFYVKKFNDQFVVSANGITRYGLSTYSFNNAYITLPPINEQKQIVDYLNKITREIDTFIEKQERQIKHLKEYRTALISEVVTGKIDVRDSGEQEVRPS